MLMHCFEVFEFEFAFEFNCLKWFQKIKLFSFLLLPFPTILARFSFGPRLGCPAEPLPFLGLARFASRSAWPSCSRAGCSPAAVPTQLAHSRACPPVVADLWGPTVIPILSPNPTRDHPRARAAPTGSPGPAHQTAASAL
jgi:hypothetical protein